MIIHMLDIGILAVRKTYAWDIMECWEVYNVCGYEKFKFLHWCCWKWLDVKTTFGTQHPPSPILYLHISYSKTYLHLVSVRSAHSEFLDSHNFLSLLPYIASNDFLDIFWNNLEWGPRNCTQALCCRTLLRRCTAF